MLTVISNISLSALVHDSDDSAGTFELLMDFFGADEIGIEGTVHSKLSVSSWGHFSK